MSIRVALEVAPKRSFASALDWPGWSRGGRTEDEALDALLAYAPRYAAVAKRAKVAFRPPVTTRGLDVVERIKGDGGTEFGVPGKPAASEDEPVSAADLRRLLALLQASWTTFDAAAKKAVGVELTKGPRGGGRELPKIIEHVREAEVGLSRPARITSSRGRGRDRRQTDGPAAPRFCRGAHRRRHRRAAWRTRETRKKPWTPRYTVRRSAWHVLDHAWEIEDRSRK